MPFVKKKKKPSQRLTEYFCTLQYPSALICSPKRNIVICENHCSNSTSHEWDRSSQSIRFPYVWCVCSAHSHTKHTRRWTTCFIHIHKWKRTTTPWCKRNACDANACGRCCALNMSIQMHGVRFHHWPHASKKKFNLEDLYGCAWTWGEKKYNKK